MAGNDNRDLTWSARLKGWGTDGLDHLDPLLALTGGAAAGICGIFGWIEGDTLAAATLLVLSVVGFALVRERSLRLDSRDRLEEIDGHVTQIDEAVDSLQSGSPYHVLSSSSTWDLAEADGSVAHIVREKRIRFNQNDVCSLYDFVDGDGKRQSEYSPGEKVHDFYSEGRKISLIALNRFYSRNEEIDFVVRRTAHDAYLEDSESIAVIAKDEIARFRMKIRWPDSRPPHAVRVLRTSAAGKRQTSVVTNELNVIQERRTYELELIDPEKGSRTEIEWDW